MADTTPAVIAAIAGEHGGEARLVLEREQLYEAFEWLFPGEAELHTQLEIAVLQRIAASQPVDAYGLRLGQWRIDLTTRLLQTAAASGILAGAIELRGPGSIPVAILASVLPFLVDIERVEVRGRDRVVLAHLRQPITVDGVEAAYARLPDELRQQLTLLEFADTIDRLHAAGVIRLGSPPELPEPGPSARIALEDSEMVVVALDLPPRTAGGE